jgi:type II secretory pathway pseudopilin PulG
MIEARRRGVTLVEIVLVAGLLVVIAGMAMPTILQRLEQDRLVNSARNLRSLLTLVRANAQFDGKRYRIRFATEDEREDEESGVDPRQPIIERENDPIEAPGVFDSVKASWVHGETLLKDVWCCEVRLGKPTIERLRDRLDRIDAAADELEDSEQDIDPYRPPLYVEPDGTCDWVTYVVTGAAMDMTLDEIEDEPRLWVLMDGMLGIAWMQRPFYEEELDLFEEKHWPAVIRQDLLSTTPLDESNVLELHESRITKGYEDG